ncbi:MAG: hypothetical protein AB7L09_21300 [Nitrospira sp.]
MRRTLQTGFAPVAPIQLLERLWKYENENENEDITLGGYHLLLAHDVMESDDKKTRFKALFEDVRDAYGPHTVNIIMDNSVIELGGAVDMRWVMEAARIATANIVVIPDEMHEADATIDKLAQTIGSLSSEEKSEFEFMFVPQGRTINEFVRCIEAAQKFRPTVSWLGIPRLAQAHLGSRRFLLEAAQQICACDVMEEDSPMSFHLLGFSDHVVDDIACAGLGIAEGIDSAVPVRCGQKGEDFRLSRSDYGKRESYWQDDKTLNDKTINNLDYVRRLIKMR